MFSRSGGEAKGRSTNWITVALAAGAAYASFHGVRTAAREHNELADLILKTASIEDEKKAVNRQVELLPRQLVDCAAKKAMIAFRDAESWKYLCPGDAEKRDELLTFFFTQYLDIMVSKRQSYAVLTRRYISKATKIDPKVYKGLDVVGGFNIEDSKTKPGLLTFATSLGATSLRFGLDPVRRLLELYEHDQEVRAKYMGDQAHYYLARMFVDPEFQGQGIGFHSLKQVLDELDGKDPRPTILSTQKEANVRFYKRLGFQVVGEETFVPSIDRSVQIKSWLMVRQPASQATLPQS